MFMGKSNHVRNTEYFISKNRLMQSLSVEKPGSPSLCRASTQITVHPISIEIPELATNVITVFSLFIVKNRFHYFFTRYISKIVIKGESVQYRINRISIILFTKHLVDNFLRIFARKKITTKCNGVSQRHRCKSSYVCSYVPCFQHYRF